jgi:hypothetical protein
VRITNPKALSLRIALVLAFLVASGLWAICVLRPMFSSGEGGLYESSGSTFRSTGNIALDVAAFVVGIGWMLFGLILAPVAVVGRRQRAVSIVLIVDALFLVGWILMFVKRP